MRSTSKPTKKAARPRATVQGSSKPATARPRAKAGPLRPSSRPKSGPSYWLLKSEPTSFSFADLLASPGRRSGWDGVRNYQARNYLRDSMRTGDLVLFYHSSADPSGIAGIARVASRAYPDPTQFDPSDHHFDPAAVSETPTWVQVDIEAVAPLARFVALEVLKQDERLARMLVLQRGQRLSIQPVQPGEWRIVLALGGLDPDDFHEKGVRRPRR